MFVSVSRGTRNYKKGREEKKERESSRNVIRGRNFKGGEKKLNGVFRRFIIVFVVVAITLYVMGPKLNYLLY